ncbi:MAG: hypothetical protein J6Z36_00980, partial [Clostridia bacterium]|nr:hypothetical protein [Clostridia bacterium]
ACKTTEDGFVYYEDPNIGICIIELPDSEEVEIPEYIEGKRVAQLGYKDIGLGYMNEYYVDGSKVKKLTVQHHFEVYEQGAYANFSNLESLTYIDFIYCTQGYQFFSMDENNNKVIRVSNRVGGAYGKETLTVKLKKSEKALNIENRNYEFDRINIPQYVTEIESGVFAGLSNVTIRTSYESKPDGWEDGWNGDCLVEWGADI